VTAPVVAANEDWVAVLVALAVEVTAEPVAARVELWLAVAVAVLATAEPVIASVLM
jgi:hypothetical protein